MRGVVVALAMLVATPAFAAPPKPASANAPLSKAACLAAHEEALTLKTDKKPHAAHDKLVICARTECLTIVRKECTDLLESVQGPTVVMEATDDKGNSDMAVKVTLDGTVVSEKMTGSAINVEPGEHTFVFERASDGKKIEEKVLIVEGEKNHKVVADYHALVPKPVEKPGGPAPEPPKKVPVLAYVAGGVGVLGLGSFALFSVLGRSKESELAGDGGCSPNCTDDDLAPVKRNYLIGDISLAVGVVGVVAAVVLALPALTQGSGGVPRTAQLGPAPWMPKVRVR